MEGIFRLSGSEKRIKELKASFDSPDRYGKGLDWTGYTVHDAANILRRYFNQLPEPIVPLEFYENFRDPLRNHQAQAVGPMDLQDPSEGDFDFENAIKTYQTLITYMPPLNRQLLLYILDLLAVFASKSDLNKMNTPNLSAIFQPGILSHPSHDMSPPDYRLSQDVLIFLIENQDHFLIGMQGTEADEQMVQEVQRGPPTPRIQSQPRTPPTTTISAGAESVRLFGGVRRNVSVSSRHSKSSIGSPDATMVAAGAGVGGGVTAGVSGGASPRLFQHAPGSPSSSSVHRSNTLPAKRSPGVPAAKFPREKISSPAIPNSTVVDEEVGFSGDAAESLGRRSGTTGLSNKVADAEPVQPVRHETASATRDLQQLETIPQNPSSEDVNDSLAGKAFNTRLAAAIAPTSAANAVRTENHLRPSSSISQEPGTYVTPTDLTTEPIPGSSNAATTITQPTTPSSDAPQSAASTGATSGKAFSSMFTRSPPSDGEQKKDGRRPNKLQKKRNAGSSVNPSARSSSQSLPGQGQGTTTTRTTTTLIAMGPESTNSEADPQQQQQQQRTQLGGGGETGAGNHGNLNIRPDASPSPSFRSRSSVTDVTDTDVATGDEDGGGGGGGITPKMPATTVGSGGGCAKSSSSASSPPREKERKRWRFSSHASSSNKHGNRSHSKNNTNDNNSSNVSNIGNAGDSWSTSHESGSIGDGSGVGGGTGAGIRMDEQSSPGALGTAQQSRKGSTPPSQMQQRQEHTPVVTEQQQQQQYKNSNHSETGKDPSSNPFSDRDKGKDGSGDAYHQHHRNRKSSSALEWFKGKLSDRRAEKHFNRAKSPPPSPAQPSQAPPALPGASGISGAQAHGKGGNSSGTGTPAGSGTMINTDTSASTGAGRGTTSALSPSSVTTTQTMFTALSSPTSTMNAHRGGGGGDAAAAAATPTTPTTNRTRLATTSTTSSSGEGKGNDTRSKRALSQQDLDMKSANLGVPAARGGGDDAERKARSMDVPR